uniref:Uncharacterized protein n=1 Tax=Panagrolaimus sp. ES5 TaxID=591445 RepID=A0AC34F7G7_9BILA
MDEITVVTFLPAFFGFISFSFLICFGCGSKKKKTVTAESKKVSKKVGLAAGTPSNEDNEADDDKKKGSAISGVKKAGKSMEKKSAMQEEDPQSLKPRSMMPQDVEEIETMKKIKEGKMRAAKDNETVEDAQSDWGAVKSMAEKMDKEKEESVEEKPKKNKKK